MYPREYFDSYWRPTIRDEIFVIMSFAEEFEPVWNHAIKPAIENDLCRKFVAHRVDVTKLSGSIITEILDSIAHSILVFGDISVTKKGKWAGQRNGNAMYEVGLSHALRPPTDIVLVKSDAEEINFDIAGIRIHTYPLDDTGKPVFYSLIFFPRHLLNATK